MAKGIVAFKRGNWKEVVQTVSIVFGQQSYTLLAEPGDAMAPLQFDPSGKLDDATKLPRGRAFNSQCELRWRVTICGDFDITYLSEEFKPPQNAGMKLSDKSWETLLSSQKLYGKPTAKDWVEVGVPGISDVYDRLSVKRVPLELKSVDYSLGGIVLMTRFCGVGEYEENAKHAI